MAKEKPKNKVSVHAPTPTALLSPPGKMQGATPNVDSQGLSTRRRDKAGSPEPREAAKHEGREHLQNKYLAVFLLSLRSQAKNWSALSALSLIFVTIFFVFFYLFEATGAFNSSITKTELLWYCMLNEFMIISGQWFHLFIQNDIRNGIVSSYLIKPISYLPLKLAEGCGAALVNFFVIGGLTITLTTIGTGVFPYSAGQFSGIVLLACLSTFLQLVLLTGLGFLAFWVDDVTPFYWLFMKCLFIFGGLFMPLCSYPLFLQKIASFTPFPLIMDYRSSVAIISPFSFNLFASMFLWIGISLFLAHILLTKGIKRENSFGGSL